MGITEFLDNAEYSIRSFFDDDLTDVLKFLRLSPTSPLPTKPAIPPLLYPINSEIIGLLEPHFREYPNGYGIWYASALQSHPDIILKISYERDNFENLISIAEDIWQNFDNWEQASRTFLVENFIQPSDMNLLNNRVGPISIDEFKKQL